MNMGRYVAEIWESKSFYDGLGLSDTIIKAHYSKDEWFMPILKELSMIHPLIAMEDESAIFINRDKTWKLGNMYQISKGEITSLSQLPKL